jgi:hypothetical protein
VAVSKPDALDGSGVPTVQFAVTVAAAAWATAVATATAAAAARVADGDVQRSTVKLGLDLFNSGWA